MEKNPKDASGSASKKPLKFKPNIPRKTTKPAITHKKPPDEAENVVDIEVLKKLKSHVDLERQSRKVSKTREPTEVAFGYCGKRTTIRSFGIPGCAHQVIQEAPLSDYHEPSSNVNTPFSADDSDVSDEEYIQPWKKDSYYPVTLPWRRPGAGDPEMLDREEFGMASTSLAEDETCIKPAEELHLLEPSEETKMIFFQLPASLPLKKQHTVASKGKEVSSESEGHNLQGLPAGLMGKMLIYKSGIIKMKLGDTLFDVSPGVNRNFPQDVAAINTREKHCCILGNLDKSAVVSPDVDSLLNSILDSD